MAVNLCANQIDGAFVNRRVDLDAMNRRVPARSRRGLVKSRPHFHTGPTKLRRRTATKSPPTRPPRRALGRAASALLASCAFGHRSSSAGFCGASAASFLTIPSSISSGEPMQFTPCLAAAFLSAAPECGSGSVTTPQSGMPIFQFQAPDENALLARRRQVRSLLLAFSFDTVSAS